MEKTPNPKCTRCKCYWIPDETDIKSSGLVCKTCKKCRGYGKCEHNRDRSKCKDCGGGGICKHNRRKSTCKDCGGGSICEHNRIKQQCKDCGGSRICEHNRIKSVCKDCGGGGICEHNRERTKCKDCGGGSICEHNRGRTKCKDCGGSEICEHNRIKSVCKDCGGSQICEHNKHYGRCKICNLELYLVNLQRIQLWRCLNNSSLKKTRSSIEYLGCDAEYFMEYMKKKMNIWNETNEVKMDFDNIHIDHIKPVSAFNLDDEDEFLDCCNYTNMQPLLAQDNLTKLNKWTDDDDIYWCNNIINKEHLNIYIN
jgi:hypothetical protein